VADASTIMRPTWLMLSRFGPKAPGCALGARLPRFRLHMTTNNGPVGNRQLPHGRVVWPQYLTD